MINKQTLDKITMNINNYFNELSGNEKYSGAILVSIKGDKIISFQCMTQDMMITLI